jgi:microcystin-dependent protein
MPVGTITPYGGDVRNNSLRQRLNDQGWLVCNGDMCNVTDYSELYAVIGHSFGGNNNQFNVPDLRGRFVRGVNDGSGRDPDATSRGASNPGGNTGDKVGSVQSDELKSHNHVIMKWRRSFKGEDATDKPYDDEGQVTGYTNYTGGNETRPKNIYLNWIIKAKNI